MINENKLLQSIFVKEWVEDQMKIFKLQYPNVPDSKLRQILYNIARKHVNDHDVHLHNDYQDNMTVNASLLSLYDWYRKNKPIAAGNGTFFYNQNTHHSPIQNVIDGRMVSRKDYQKKRDTYLGADGDTSSYYYQYFDMMQMEAKVMINAIYGSFGATTFQLYNCYTAAATTATAQSLISTTAMAFEAFLSNSVRHKSLNELMIFFKRVLEDDEHLITLRGLTIYNDKRMVFEYLKSRFVEYKESYSLPIWRVLEKCTNEQLTRIYYTNNLFEFVKNDIIKERLISIYTKTKSFRNPNNVPENIQDDLMFVWDYCREFVFYNHAYTEQIDRLKHDRRDTVTLIDTDSNVINIKPWVDWEMKEIAPLSNTTMNEDDEVYCAVNTLAFLVTKMARELLDRYAEDCNVLPEYRSRLNIKNEFYFPKMLLANVKKRYIAKMALKEGKRVNKIELKGHDFKKAGVSENIEKELMGIIKKNIIEHPSVDVIQIMKDVSQLERKIRDSLNNRERTYLSRMNCKSIKSYADPYSEGAVTGPILWNTVNPHNTINIPDKCDVVFIKIKNEKDLYEKLGDKYPEVVDKISRYIYHSGIKQLENRELKYLALPNDNSKIPEWVTEIIDVERTVTRNAGTFYGVLKAISFTTVTAGDNEYATNILDI